MVADMKFPTVIKYQHWDYQSACNEAKRLATIIAEHEFVVLEAKKSFKFNNFIETDYTDNEQIPF
jgi:hypothetical protein